MDDRERETRGRIGDERLGAARAAQRNWAGTPVGRRLEVVGRLRRRIAACVPDLVAALAGRPGRTAAESLAAEILPLADALRFLEREGGRILAPRRLGRRGRPAWLFGIEAELRREPFGLVLVLAPSNYPLFLAGVHAVQALAAGNAVAVKPAPGCSAPLALLARLLAEAGLPDHLFQLLGEEVDDARTAIESGVDLVVLTGSAGTGRQVLSSLAPSLTPAILELSGNDAMFVLEGADTSLVADALAWGLSLNGGATCIAPRRVFAPRPLAQELQARLAERLPSLPAAPVPLPVRHLLERLLAEAERAGARIVGRRPSAEDPMVHPLVVLDAHPDLGLLREDVFAPVLSFVPVDGPEEALVLADRCPYALGASVFGPEAEARSFAARLDVGSVSVNDVIAPTADPRLPFGGRRSSGYGVTRGGEGLLALTRVKTVSVRKGRFRPHYEKPRPGDEDLFTALLHARHAASWRCRASALAVLLRGLAHRK
jgi:acyl-CoA reductase-like NAD-dependent aldehyde dehydrogenase